MLNIALNTFKEIVRNKFLYLILFFAFVFIAFSLLLGKLTIGDDDKVIVDFGLAMIEIFGLIGVLFVGSQLLFKEIEGKTIFLILSKPIKRYEFILGKFFGFSFTIMLILLLQAILFLAVLMIKDIAITHLILISLVFTFFKLEICLALVLFFQSFMSNILTILMTLMVYVISHSYFMVLDMMMRIKSMMAIYIAKVVQLLFPPFQSLNTKDLIGSFESLSPSFFLSNSVYALGYLCVILFLTVYIFDKKKFEN